MSLIDEANTVATVGSQRISSVNVVYPVLTTGVSWLARDQTVLMVCDVEPVEMSVGVTFNMGFWRSVGIVLGLK